MFKKILQFRRHKSCLKKIFTTMFALVFCLVLLSSCSTLPIAVKHELPKSFAAEAATEDAPKYGGSGTPENDGTPQEMSPVYGYYGIALSGARAPLLREEVFCGIDLSLYDDGFFDFFEVNTLPPEDIASYRKVYGVLASSLSLREESEVKGLQLGVFGSVARCVDGAQIGLFSISDCSVKGLQIGAVSLTDTLYGLQLNGLSSIAGDVWGAQGALLLNVCGSDRCRGAQVSAINFTGMLCGGQLGIVNVVAGSAAYSVQCGLLNWGDGNHIQLGGINVSSEWRQNSLSLGGINITHKMNNGLSFGGVNTGSYMRGIQIGIGNVIREFHGAQIGMFNIATDKFGDVWKQNINTGVQIGLINRIQNLNGVQIGLLNFKKGSSYPIPLLRISRD